MVEVLCNKIASLSSDEVADSTIPPPPIYLILPAALGHGAYSASNRNQYQKVFRGGGVKALPVHKADNIIAICELIV
jgi:hypothetical protein